ncbi:MAG TPA: hypothetical protein HA263_08130 [Methanoregulaceae archaeon]|nr:hypothetical protein [Methanoregulaceae archaeon]
MPADPSAAWDSGLIARSNAERGRYAPEFDTDQKRPPAPVPAYVGRMTDGT